jgi:hypothetical protein
MSSTRNQNSSITRSWQVLGAGGVIVILAGLLALRLFVPGPAQAAAPAAPDGQVSPPAPFDLQQLAVPNWQGRESADWPVAFRTDLDLLAPLGDGPANAAVWFKDFSKAGGTRLDEHRAALDQRIEHPYLKLVLPADHPLLLEAEPWCDQATMRFYPDIYPLNGWETEVPNLVLCLTLAKSWVARGLESSDAAAREDCRRAIRLGRLLRQDDTTIIADLVGLVCINIGADGLNRLARREGDLELALVSSVVQGEVAPQRLLTSERITRYEISPYLRRTPEGSFTLDLPDGYLDRLLEAVSTEPDQRFSVELINALTIVRALGDENQQQRVNQRLDELSRSDNPFMAEMVRWHLANPPDRDHLEEAMKSLG